MGVSSDDLLEVSVNEGSIVEGLDDLLTSAADEETRSEWSKGEQRLYCVIDLVLLSKLSC